jgi:hypothetical protein
MWCALWRYTMSALRQALEKQGFKPGHDVIRHEKEAEARDYLAAEDRSLKAGKRDSDREKILGELSATSSVQKFRALAKKLLLLFPELIGEVVQIAHARGMREKRKEGGAALIAQLLQTRTDLSATGLSDEEKARIVSRTISKH